MGVDLLAPNAPNRTCAKRENLPWGYVDNYTAHCIDGLTLVELFVHDGSFGTENTVTPAAECEQEASNDEGKKQPVEYLFLYQIKARCKPVKGTEKNLWLD